MTAPHDPAERQEGTLGGREAVRLVASREITTRLRSKVYRLTTLFVVLALVALSLVLKLVGGGAAATVGVTRAQAALAPAVAAGGRTVGVDLSTVVVADAMAGEQKVREGSLDALVVTDGATLRAVVERNLDPRLQSALRVLAGQLALQQAISDLGGNPGEVQQRMAAATVGVTTLAPPQHYDSQQLVLGVIAGILIYLSLMIHGQTVAQGVVEEKSSRVVELLLATIRPTQLMAGKVLGIGLAGLLQMVLVAGAGAAVALGLGVLTISVSATVSTVVWLVVWYLLGFFAYALAMAALAALVSRQEDVGGVVAPVLVFVIIGYVIGVSVLPADPGNTFVGVLSLIPVFSPMLMPIRLAMGGVPAWQAALAVVLMLATIPGLVALSGRMYRNAVLRTGARVRFADALRPL